MKFYFLFISIWFSSLAQLCAQPPAQFSPQKQVDVLPPSPNAASLGKFGGLDLNISSGVINQTIPLYNFNSINLSLPLSLSYTSLGVKVDEMAGNVGINWNLLAGGGYHQDCSGAAGHNFHTYRASQPGRVPRGLSGISE